MPNEWSEASAENLSQANEGIQRVFNEVLKHRDCSIIDGKRTLAEQAEYVRSGASMTMDSRHLVKLEDEGNPDAKVDAVDATPYPCDWNNHEELLMFGGFVMGIAATLGVPLRWGGDWDGDGNPRNNGDFDDLVHFESPR